MAAARASSGYCSTAALSAFWTKPACSASAEPPRPVMTPCERAMMLSAMAMAWLDEDEAAHWRGRTAAVGEATAAAVTAVARMEGRMAGGIAFLEGK
jgi:hypothetical protein